MWEFLAGFAVGILVGLFIIFATLEFLYRRYRIRLIAKKRDRK